ITDEPLSASTPDSGTRDTAEPVVGDTAESVARDTAEIETEADDTAEPASDAETAAAEADDAKADAEPRTPAETDEKSAAPAEADGTAAPDTAAGAGSTADVESADAEDEDVVPAALQEPITPLPDPKPQEEFLVIDVDGDQQAVVDAAVSGHSVVVDTPPGTGATQVAVAVATTLAHTGKSVLFLAQTSDALDDFSSRLASVGLSDFAVDTREGSENIRKQLIG